MPTLNRRIHISGTHLIQMWRSRPQSACLSKSVAWLLITLPNLDEKRPIETNPYKIIIENHVNPPCSTKSNKRSPFVKKEVPLYRERKLQIPTKMIEYIEVNEHSLLTEIVNDFHEDIDPNSSFENCEVFTHPKSLDTPEITLTEKKILQAQEVSFTEISVDQYQVCELEENSNCIVNDIQYVSAVQVFDPFTVKVSFTEEASPLQAQPINWSIVRNGVIFSNKRIFILLHPRTRTIFL